MSPLSTNIKEKRMESSMNEQTKLDLRGLFVPETLYKIEIEMNKMEDTDRVLVLTDDLNSEEWIVRWAHKNGHELIASEKTTLGLNITLKKGGYAIQ